MLPLKNNPILTEYQIELLKTFFHSPVAKHFFLTGGTALAAFYLAHRRSEDLDLFTVQDYDSLGMEKLIEEMARVTGAKIKVKVRSATYNEIYLENSKKGWMQRIDIVKEQPILFGKRKKVDFATVDSLENIAAGKILTVFSRMEPKDYLDLYFIFKETGLDFFKLFERTKQKDLGLHEFPFANMIAEVENLKQFPETIKPFQKQELVNFFLDLSNELLIRIKPKT